MKPTSIALRTTIVLLLVLSIAFEITGPRASGHGSTPEAVSACDLPATQTGVHSGMSATPGPGMMMSMNFDLAFIDMMTLHHEGAIGMAKVALERGEHEEIRALAQAIIDTQDAEIEQLLAWRAEWYPDAPPVTMSDMMQMRGMDHLMPGMAELMESMGSMPMDPAADTAALCSVTDSFDRAFIDMMIPHHQSAIMMAQAALQHARHQELKDLANEIIDAQQREIEQMTGWRAAWYGEATPGTPAADSSSVTISVKVDEFSVTASESEFHVGQTYRFVVTNDGEIPHELMILPQMPDIGQKDMEELHHEALAVIDPDDLAPGATAEIEVTFTEPGAFELVCALTGHYDAGMKLTVTAAG